MMSNRSFAIMMCLAIILTAIMFAFDPNNRAYEVEEILPATAETTTTSSTTTTTIDLSFLNTTTTTQPKPTSATSPTSTNVDEFFACVRWRESHGDYTAVNPTGTFMGAYQIYQGGWDVYAARMGRDDLVGIPPHTASPADQDAVALAMYNDLGTRPWGGACQ